MDAVYKILAVVLTAAVPILTGFLCDWIHRAACRTAFSAKNERTKAIVGEIDKAVRSAVIYVNQTFVDTLKKEHIWNEESAKQAFNTAFQTVVETISADAENYILNTFGDIHKYLTVKIEENVEKEKSWLS